ncbi:MAG: hypothetical protein QXM96_00280 [Candidatus Woesearchaeota archaeon]
MSVTVIKLTGDISSNKVITNSENEIYSEFRKKRSREEKKQQKIRRKKLRKDRRNEKKLDRIRRRKERKLARKEMRRALMEERLKKKLARKQMRLKRKQLKKSELEKELPQTDFEDLKPTQQQDYGRNEQQQDYGSNEQQQDYGRNEQQQDYGSNEQQQDYGSNEQQQDYGRNFEDYDESENEDSENSEDISDLTGTSEIKKIQKITDKLEYNKEMLARLRILREKRIKNNLPTNDIENKMRLRMKRISELENLLSKYVNFEGEFCDSYSLDGGDFYELKGRRRKIVTNAQKKSKAKRRKITILDKRLPSKVSKNEIIIEPESSNESQQESSFCFKCFKICSRKCGC